MLPEDKNKALAVMRPLTVIQPQQTLWERQWSKISIPIRVPIKVISRKTQAIVLFNLFTFLPAPLWSASPRGYHCCSTLGKREMPSCLLMFVSLWCVSLCTSRHLRLSRGTISLSLPGKYLQHAVVGYKGRAAVLLGRCMEAYEPPPPLAPHRLKQ